MNDRCAGPRPGVAVARPMIDHCRATPRPAGLWARPSVERKGELDGAVDDAKRVITEAPHPSQPTGLGLEAGRIDLWWAAGRRPRRLVGPIGIEPACCRHLDRLARAQVESTFVEGTLDNAALEPADRDP